jgi:predicted transcriptional regulator
LVRDLTAVAAEIVSAYVRNNSVRPSELPELLTVVRSTLEKIVAPVPEEPVSEAPQPKVPIRKSIMDDHLVCLEDGKHFRSLKRHLHSVHQLTPDGYRAKWRLPPDYPMVAPAYATTRSNLAKTMGLGRKGASETPAADGDAAEGSDETTRGGRGRKRPAE